MFSYGKENLFEYKQRAAVDSKLLRFHRVLSFLREAQLANFRIENLFEYKQRAAVDSNLLRFHCVLSFLREAQLANLPNVPTTIIL